MQATRALVREAWSEYLDAVTAELVNAPVSIEVIDDQGAPVLEAHRVALRALGYDDRDDVFEVAVARHGAHMPGVFHRLVDHPRRIESDSHTLPGADDDRRRRAGRTAHGDHDRLRARVRGLNPDHALNGGRR